MFVNTKELKKLMKEAFKAEFLIVGSREDMYYIQGSYWKMLCKKRFVPKEILGLIVELTGEIPGDGECYCAGKSGNQMQLNPMEIEIPPEATEIEITDFVVLHKLGVAQRILQFPSSGNVYLINNKFAGMISARFIDAEHGELDPECALCSVNHGVFWANNVMKFTVCFREDDEHWPALMQLKNVKLYYEGGIANA